MTNQNMQPIYILPEGANQTKGRDAQRLNIAAARLVAESIRTTLGPKGMDKMLVDSMGEITITNDGATILDEMQLEHPSAKMIAEVAKTQEEEVGDGTTSVVIFAGELLQKAELLLDENIHPTMIIKGYRLAAEKAKEILKSIAEPISTDDKNLLKQIAITSMTGKSAEVAKSILADLTVNAVQSVSNKNESGSFSFNLNDIKIEKKSGGSVEDSSLVTGIILDKERVNSAMPTMVKDAKLALLSCPLEVKDTDADMKISITDPAKLQEFLDLEEHMIKKMVDTIKNSGATVVVCQKGIDDLAQYYLAKEGIFALRRVKLSDMDKIVKATGATLINIIDDLKESHLGYAGEVREEKIGDEDMTFITECKHPRAVTILVRGGTSHVIDEVKRAIEDSIGDLSSVLNVQKIVGGAGAVEIELSRELRQYATTLTGREQLAVNSFAQAIDVIPKTLAENAGLDPIDVLAELKSAHESNQKWAGINVFTGKVIDSIGEGIIEPLKVKLQAVSSATEVATMILRIDDVIFTSGGNNMPQQPNPGNMMQ